MIAVAELSEPEQPFRRVRSTLRRDLQVPSTCRPALVSVVRRKLFGLVSAAVILHLLTTTRRAWLEHRALRAVGLIGYGLYLWHYPILQHGIPWTRRIVPLPSPVCCRW